MLLFWKIHNLTRIKANKSKTRTEYNTHTTYRERENGAMGVKGENVLGGMKGRATTFSGKFGR